MVKPEDDRRSTPTPPVMGVLLFVGSIVYAVCHGIIYVLMRPIGWMLGK